MESTVLEAVLKTSHRFIVRRRGDCLGALVAGFVFTMLAPGSEDPTAFRMLGVPLLLVGAALSALSLVLPKPAAKAQ